MVRRGDRRRAVDVVDVQGYVGGGDQPTGVLGAEGQDVLAGLFVARDPMEPSGLAVERRAGRKAGRHTINDRIPIGVDGNDRELQGGPFTPILRYHRHYHWRPVRIRHLDANRFAIGPTAVGDAQDDVLIQPGLVEPGRP